MRLLFTCRPGSGHFQPLVPLARAAQAHGHAVAFAAAEPVAADARAAGFDCFPAGLDAAQSTAALARRGIAYRELPIGQMRVVSFGTWFSGIETPPRLADLDRVIGAFRPDILVHGLADFAAPLAAATAGLPWATVGFGPLPAPEVLALAEQGVRPLWQDRSLPPPRWGGLFAHLYVDPFPPALQHPSVAEISHRVGIRPAGAAQAGGASRSKVYVTFGTLWNNGPAAVGLMRAAISGSAATGRDVVATVGAGTDPAALDPLPPRVRVHGYVPQDQLLPDCACIVAHAGAGTLLGALGWGVPALLVPQFADQFYNAAQAARAGVALVLQPSEATEQAIAAGVRRLLDEASFTQRAQAVRGELGAMSPAADVLDRILGLAGR